jgi:6,7-dimethyl-8-ribityllumazine synthase
MHHFEGNFDAKGHRYALIAARFNQPITRSLLEGALDGLKRHGAMEENIAVAWVPGAFELPLTAQKMAESKRYDAVICLGAVIRGETPHFDYVAGQTAAGIMQTSLSCKVPVIFAVLTTETKEQAEVRAGIKGANMGFHGAMTAIEMVNLLKTLA